jgi:hypothetical protein
MWPCLEALFTCIVHWSKHEPNGFSHNSQASDEVRTLIATTQKGKHEAISDALRPLTTGMVKVWKEPNETPLLFTKITLSAVAGIRS